MRAKQTGAWRGSDWLARCYTASASATAAVRPAPTDCGAASPAPPARPPSTRGHALRTGDPGHLFLPGLLQAQQDGSAQQAQGHGMMPSRPEPAPYLILGAGLVLVQPHICQCPGLPASATADAATGFARPASAGTCSPGKFLSAGPARSGRGPAGPATPTRRRF